VIVVVVFLLLAAALLGVLAVAPRPRTGRMWSLLYDSGHAVLFGGVALALFGSLRAWGLSRAWVYPAAFVLASGIGSISEAVQFFGPRDADLMDAARNAAGAAAFLLTVGVVDIPNLPRRVKILSLLGAVLLVGSCLVAPARLAAAYVHRARVYPRLADFESLWERPLVGVSDADLDRLPPPSNWDNASGHAARITFHPSDGYPRLVFRAPPADWKPHDMLVFELYSEEPDTVSLHLRIHDKAHDETWTDRYRVSFRVAPGAHVIRIPLTEVAAGPRDRALQLDKVESMALFLNRPEAEVVLWMDAFRLEGDTGEAPSSSDSN